MRLNIEDKDVKGVFYKYEDTKSGKIKNNNISADVCGILDKIFDREEGERTVHTFRLDYLPLNNLPIFVICYIH